jgi:acyl carrier protein
MKNEKHISNKILEITKKISKNKNINLKSKLIGSSSFIDSMTLVQLCIALEDFSNKLNFQFDWTSEKAMSRSQSIFRNVEALSKEFLRQMKINK